MKELSLHILDLIQNSLSAGASMVWISVKELISKNTLLIEIADNGCGIQTEKLEMVLDPFYTERKSRKFGLGLPLFRAAAEQSGGRLLIESEPGKGTKVTVSFIYDHIDRAPLGNMADTLIALMLGNPEVDFCYNHSNETKEFKFDTREVKKYLLVSELAIPQVALKIREYLKNEIATVSNDNSLSANFT